LTYFRFLILAFLAVQATIKTMKMTADGWTSYGPFKPGARPDVAQNTFYTLYVTVMSQLVRTHFSGRFVWLCFSLFFFDFLCFPLFFLGFYHWSESVRWRCQHSSIVDRWASGFWVVFLNEYRWYPSAGIETLRQKSTER
jgi:hypothetical protein